MFTFKNSEGHCRNVNLATVVGVADSVAHPMCQQLKQFNGVNGCSFCLHPGISVPKGKGQTRVYPQTLQYQARTAEQMLKDAISACNTGKPVDGIKGVSILHCLPTFDIISGFIPDYMHCILLGVCRQLAKLWFDSKNSKMPFYIGLKVNVIDERLLSIKPPSSISRTPRSITLHKFWKAHEWLAWLLYYGIPVLTTVLPDKFLMH